MTSSGPNKYDGMSREELVAELKRRDIGVDEEKCRREPEPAQNVTGLDVLVVDDSEDSASYVSAALQFHGHKVLTAHDGTSAIEICSRMHPDVVLLDIALPDMDGFEVAERIRALDGMGKTVVAAISGFVIDKGIPEASLFDHFLQKPLDPDDLVSFVQRCGHTRPAAS